MSNVLIGIIGVILFIGLALAGAVYLGPQFKSASDDARAATVISQAGQVAAAFAAHQAREGRPASHSDPKISLVPRYLKSDPLNLSGSDNAYNSIDNTGKLNGAGVMIVMGLYDGELERGTRVCRAIMKHLRRPMPATGNPRIASLDDASFPIGCFQPTRTIGDIHDGYVYAYARY